MSAFLTQAYLLEHYGPRLGVKQLAKVLDLAETTIYNQASSGTLVVPTYMDGKKRFADTADVAAYLERKRQEARAGNNEGGEQ